MMFSPLDMSPSGIARNSITYGSSKSQNKKAISKTKESYSCTTPEESNMNAQLFYKKYMNKDLVQYSKTEIQKPKEEVPDMDDDIIGDMFFAIMFIFLLFMISTTQSR